MPVFRPPAFGKVPLRDNRGSGVLAQEALARGEAVSMVGADISLHKYNALQFAKIAALADLKDPPAPGHVLFAVSQKDLNTYMLIL